MHMDACQALMTSLATDEDVVSALDAEGYRSIFDIARQPARIFCERVNSLELDQAMDLHALAFKRAMAQYALIALWANLTEQDLTLVVDTPEWFIDSTAAGVPTNSLDVLLYISRLKQWQQRVAVPEAEAMGYFKYANAADRTESDATAMLTYIHGWDLDTTRAMSRFLSDEGNYALFPTTFAEVVRLESWMRIGAKIRVGSSTVDALYRMSLQDAAAETSSLIKQVAEQLAATLQK